MKQLRVGHGPVIVLSTPTPIPTPDPNTSDIYTQITSIDIDVKDQITTFASTEPRPTTISNTPNRVSFHSNLNLYGLTTVFIIFTAIVILIVFFCVYVKKLENQKKNKKCAKENQNGQSFVVRSFSFQQRLDQEKNFSL